jgi:hypothetical protein
VFPEQLTVEQSGKIRLSKHGRCWRYRVTVSNGGFTVQGKAIKRQSIRQFADRVKISAQNAVAEGIIVRVVGPRSYKISERKMFRKIGNYDDREINYCK